MCKLSGEELKVNQKELEKAILWAEKHWAFVEWLCQNQELTDERIEELKIEARKREDYLFEILLCVTKGFNDSKD